jgi:predicted nucleic acid-binding protein
MKKVLLDASSAILLYKVDLLARLTQVYNVSLTHSVLHELTRKNYPGAETFRQYAYEMKIKIIDVQNVSFPLGKAVQSPPSLGQGELDTIKCFWTDRQDFVIIDDGRAARYCRKNDIAFINALIFPRLLYFSRSISLAECNADMNKVVQVGRYSREVIAWAQNCKRESLLFAIPDNCGRERR